MASRSGSASSISSFIEVHSSHSEKDDSDERRMPSDPAEQAHGSGDQKGVDLFAPGWSGSDQGEEDEAQVEAVVAPFPEDARVEAHAPPTPEKDVGTSHVAAAESADAVESVEHTASPAFSPATQPTITPIVTIAIPSPALVLVGQILFMLFTALLTLSAVRAVLMVEKVLFDLAMSGTLLSYVLPLSSSSSSAGQRLVRAVSHLVSQLVMGLGWLTINVAVVSALRRSHKEVVRGLWLPLKITYPFFTGETSVHAFVTEICELCGLSQRWHTHVNAVLALIPCVGLWWSVWWWTCVPFKD